MKRNILVALVVILSLGAASLADSGRSETLNAINRDQAGAIN